MTGKSLRAVAVGLLARREHTRVQLRAKLEPLAEDPAVLDALLDELEQGSYLSDARFAEQFVRRRRGRQGPDKLAYAMRERGVAPEAAEAALAESRDAEPAEALRLLRRRFPEPPGSADERARQGRFLQNRGFRVAVIRRVLDLPAEPLSD